MIALNGIEKVYQTTEKKVKALKGITLKFRESEFVCILGPSGCGKTTLLNILGGLDRYTSGDLVIDGVSTALYKDSDWDTYRNNRVGFVFQSYNLISHQTVLENVETALTISGVKKEERRKRAIEALVKVGLSEHLRKKPRQLSGGEMQRVAIARAIVNNPSVILADEPTGALDSKNSVQIMNLLKEISKDRLVITVTHNNELADDYATRIIKISDGKVVSDSNKYECADEIREKKPTQKKSVMPYSLTSKLSLKNLAGKKVRSILTSVASSIAIIGIALVLSCSNGLTSFVNRVQRDTMSAIPITVATSTTSYEPLINSIFGYLSPSENSSSEGSEITGDVIVNHTLKNAIKNTITNDITPEYVDYLKGLDSSRVNYDFKYSLQKNIYKSLNVKLGSVHKPVNLLVSNADKWNCIPSDNSLVSEQYEIYGKYPEKANELALVVNKNSSISDTVLTTYFLDILSSEKDSYTYDEIFTKYGVFNLILNDDYYYESTDGLFKENKLSITDYILKYYYDDKPSQKGFVAEEIEKNLGSLASSVYGYDVPIDEATGIELKIVGIFKLKQDTQYGMFSSSPICHTSALNDLVMACSCGGEIDGKTYPVSKIYEAQSNSIAKNVLSGKAIENALQLRIAYNKIGWSDCPNSIYFYPKTISDKDYLISYLNAYNEGKAEEAQIKYVDNVGVAIELVRSILGGVSAILIALTSISLIVSAIMIGIITYVSVIERTKEIGILRSVGARKKDVVSLFVTETGMIGLTAGITGIILTLILTIPINAIFKNITGVSNLIFMSLPNVLILMAVSIILTVVAGLIPSFMAGKADPVKALRSE